MFEFALSFPQFPEFGEVPICEPFKFDGFALTVKQKEGGFARDVSYGGEEVSLEFYDVCGKPCTPYQLPDGRVLSYLTHGLDFIFAAIKAKGTQTKIDFIIKYNGQGFTMGRLDVKTSTTDSKYRFVCKMVQDSRRAQITKNEETYVDLFSSEDLFGNPITPLGTSKILLKSKPIFSKSTWKQKPGGNVAFAGGSRFVNFTSYLQGTGALKDSLVPVTNTSGIGSLTFAVNNFKYLRAREDISEMSVDIDLDVDFIYRTVSGDGDSFASITLSAYVFDEDWNVSDDGWESYQLYSKTITGTTDVDFHLPSTLTLDLPFIGRGRCFAIFWNLDWDITNAAASTTQINDFLEAAEYFFAGIGNVPIGVLFDNNGDYADNGPTKWVFNKADMTISATSTGIDSVIEGVRYIDAYKQTAKFINGTTVEAPDFDFGGRFYDQFILNGNLGRQRKDVPFRVQWKDLVDMLMEVCGDAKIRKDDIYIGQYPDFYPDRELGVLMGLPDEGYTESYDPKHCVLRFEMNYKYFEQSDDADMTIDGIHTETQYHTGQEEYQNVKQVSLPQVRDPFAFRTLQQRSVEVQETTSLDTDEKCYLLDVVEVPPGYVRSFQKRYLQRKTNIPGQIEILNNDQNGLGTPTDWTLLGLGSSFSIGGGLNQGSYIISEINESVITGERIGGGVITNQNTIIQIIFVLTGVQYINRTNEGFTSITGLQGGDNFSNLQYGIKDNIAKHWKYLIATWEMFGENDLRLMKYKNDPKLVSQFGSEPIMDYKTGIVRGDFAVPKVTPKLITKKAIAPFLYMRELIDRNDQEEGFVTVLSPNNRVDRIYITDLSELIRSGICTVTGEQKYEPEFLVIEYSGGVLSAKELGYDQKLVGESWFETSGNYIRFYDMNSMIFTNDYRFDKVQVNGSFYASIDELASALKNL